MDGAFDFTRFYGHYTDFTDKLFWSQEAVPPQE